MNTDENRLPIISDNINMSLEERETFHRRYMRELSMAEHFFNFDRYSYQDLTYTEILTLINACGLRTIDNLERYLCENYEWQPCSNVYFEQLFEGALTYFTEVIEPELAYIIPQGNDLEAINSLTELIQDWSDNWDLERLTTEVYNIGNRLYTDNDLPLRNFFRIVYQVLLGQESGPRLPVFIHMLGRDRFLGLVNERI